MKQLIPASLTDFTSDLTADFATDLTAHFATAATAEFTINFMDCTTDCTLDLTKLR